METVLAIIRQDFEAANLAFDADDFGSMNTYANRIMANAILIPEGQVLALLGFFLKDVAVEYLTLRGRREDTAFATAKALGRQYLDALDKSLKTKRLSGDELWNQYYQFDNEIREFVKDSFEQKIYSADNAPFTRDAFKWFIGFLDQERETLLNPRNMLLEGILNEMGRIYKVHGGTLIEVYALSLLMALQRYHAYLRYEFTGMEGSIYSNNVRKRLFPLVDRVVNVLSKGEGLDTSEINSILWDSIVEWRKAFIRLGELPTRARRREVAIERGIEIPADLKQKITDSLTKSLEREVH